MPPVLSTAPFAPSDARHAYTSILHFQALTDPCPRGIMEPCISHHNRKDGAFVCHEHVLPTAQGEQDGNLDGAAARGDLRRAGAFVLRADGNQQLAASPYEPHPGHHPFDLCGHVRGHARRLWRVCGRQEKEQADYLLHVPGDLDHRPGDLSSASDHECE